MRGIWKRIAGLLENFSGGIYLSDNFPNLFNHEYYKYMKMLIKVIELMTKGKITLHFQSRQETQTTFRNLGFNKILVHEPETFYGLLPIPASRKSSFVRIIEAKV
jgi:hypothetical protein